MPDKKTVGGACGVGGCCCVIIGVVLCILGPTLAVRRVLDLWCARQNNHHNHTLLFCAF